MITTAREQLTHEPQSIEVIAHRAGLTVRAAAEQLILLAMRGEAEEGPTGYYKSGGGLCITAVYDGQRQGETGGAIFGGSVR